MLSTVATTSGPTKAKQLVPTCTNLDGGLALARTTQQVLKEIKAFRPTDGEWLTLDELLDELWQLGVTHDAIPVLLGIFERFPDDDGAGVLWSIVHGLESLEGYESELRASVARTPSIMGTIMLKRLEMP